MLKTVIIKLEGVILNDDYLHFKYYDLLWFHLRRYPGWENFGKIIALRELLIQKAKDETPYMTIAQQHLPARDYNNYLYEIRLFNRKYYAAYLRMIPGMRELIRSLKYYYNTAVFSYKKFLLQIAMDRFWLEDYVSYFRTGTAPQNSSVISRIINSLLEETRSRPEETVLIGNRLDTEIALANEMGLITVQVLFNARVKGTMVQGDRERQFFQSLERYPGYKQKPTRHREAPQLVATTPQEISKEIQSLEGKKQGAPEQEKKISLWDVAREVLLPEFENEEE